MKENNNKLTLQETEQLCHLYMDCRLTVLEETELEYILGKITYSSPCIDDVRMVIGIPIPKETTQSPKIRHCCPKRRMWIGVAVSITILFAVGISIFNRQTVNNNYSTGVCIAYANGQKVSAELSVQQVKSDMEQADEFLKHIAKMKAEEQEQIENFIKQIEK